jgi:hypothetical protein
MRVDMTQRATIALQKADGLLKKQLERVLQILESGSNLSAEQVLASRSRPGVFIVKIDDYRLFFQPGKDVIQVLDIVSPSQAYQ